jgi:hypothetical protein
MSYELGDQWAELKVELAHRQIDLEDLMNICRGFGRLEVIEWMSYAEQIEVDNNALKTERDFLQIN